LRDVPLGFDPRGVIVVSVAAPTSYDSRDRARLEKDALDRLRALSGVLAVGAAAGLPFVSGGSNGVRGEGAGTVETEADRRIVSAGYFATLRIAIHRGREFSQRDTAETTPVVIINRALERRLFPEGDALGRQISIVRGPYGDPRRPLLTVVGVATDLADTSLQAPGRPMFFMSTSQRPGWTLPSYAIRTTQAVDLTAPAVRAAFKEIAPGVAVTRIAAMESLIAASIDGPRQRAWTVGAFGVSAVLLAAIGLYGILSRFVVDRRREIAVRLALGAKTSDVVRLVVAQGAVPVLAGGAAGLAGALAAGRLIRSMLFGVGPADPFALGAAAIAVAAAAALALLLPARRAARVDPAHSLAAEA
jgi:putative ABC transport system permease protein